MGRERDPRPYQIAVLSALLAWGVLALDFEAGPAQVALLASSALAAQLACTRLWGLPRFDPRSALISGLSLSLLLRTDALPLAPAVAALAIVSKFAIRRRGKHVFNPTCFALVAALAAGEALGRPAVWVSAGQWGSAAWLAFAIAGLGQLVVRRAERSDVTWAFLASYAALQLGRALWIGDPLAIPLHGLRSGALLLFAFFMISDPRTLPDSRAGRVLFAACVAAGATWVQYGLHRSNGLLWALACAAPLVPLLDRLFPGERHAWRAAPAPQTPHEKEDSTMRSPRRPVPLAPAALLLALLALLGPGQARAFCGFYVAKADAKLFNHASQVVLVRDGDRTVITMSNDFQGEPEEFAMVVPVPTFVERDQINVGERKLVEHLDAYTSPRLVEYFDPDPCARVFEEEAGDRRLRSAMRLPAAQDAAARASGVTIEASYDVGEYDVLILSAQQSEGLAAWLRAHGYRLPEGAESVLSSYLARDMRFFVARVDLSEQARLGFHYLRPLQIAYESPRFMLPIRLGMLNADGPQELFVYTLTRRGRVETTNYRTVKLPTGAELPVFVKSEFGDFYAALFDEQVRREDMRTVFTEYAWDMAWCDPCAADPLSREELRALGVFWLPDGPASGPARDVFVTRLHVRYDREHFPADLVFQETGDRGNFQGRYVLRHPFRGRATCAAAEAYRRRLAERQEREARTLASLTGWSLDEIRRRVGLGGEAAGEPPWWRRLWRN